MSQLIYLYLSQSVSICRPPDFQLGPCLQGVATYGVGIGIIPVAVSYYLFTLSAGSI